MRETSGMLRERYIEDVLGPIPEPQKKMMIETFDSGIAVGMIAGAEVVYASVDELVMSAKFVINKQKGKS